MEVSALLHVSDDLGLGPAVRPGLLVARFSFSDLPDFFDMELRGDLSAMLPPSIEDLNGPDSQTVRHSRCDPRFTSDRRGRSSSPAAFAPLLEMRALRSERGDRNCL